ncbi:EAL domain protein [Myxococcus xanthus DK 1622]|uniref:EAL domain protein n=2 Tax=Myxococcaceae TaxID=31 RepID=Q1D9C4_MYXXD|nr:EAL domain protein [Myxococcus xanthus DK 1622]NOJ54126.1 EAL domain-containing protein [Myxococcus xanthus]QPM82040.1 EAL domain-containing protein [Myxococcus xanthus]QVW71289.1 EAL domain-containing protein [Myxococcus xanthus DZ2]UEO02581.1 EAL domain-containing protein [Myxococcus xanthus DZ2]
MQLLSGRAWSLRCVRLQFPHMSLPLSSAPAPAWLWKGDEPSVTSVFQPIVDLLRGEVIGHEVLSRGPGEFREPHVLFTQARLEGYTWELERACWTSALRCISTLPEAQRSAPFFFNVSPDVLSDPRFGDGSTEELLARYGLNPKNLVLEITEKAAFEDNALLQRLTRQCSALGFGIALDDFGAGHSGLVTLVNSAPQFIKLDQALVRDIHRHSYQQHLVKSLVSFAASVNATLIAEGVETWNELAVLLRLGIRHAQGYLVARPAPVPVLPSVEFEARRHEAMRALDFREDEDDETVGSIVIRRNCVERPVTPEELERLFQQKADVDHVAVLHSERLEALVLRRATATKGAAQVAPLIVEDRMALTTLARLAMERAPEALYDPVVVTDAQKRFLGTVTMQQLIRRITELLERRTPA